MNGLNDFQMEIINGATPKLSTEATKNFYEAIGCECPLSENYMISINDKVTEPKEHYDGVELPRSVLTDDSLFNKELFNRTIQYVGTKLDN